MNILQTTLPSLLSYAIGFLVLNFLRDKERKENFLLFSILSIGLGLFLSSLIVFISFILFNELNKIFILSAHLYSIILLSIYLLKSDRKIPWNFTFDWHDAIGLMLIGVLLIPYWIQSSYYQYGGWDAWAVWNFKARFLILSGENWQNLFDPVLWRSSPHYPLLLPNVNVWNWILQTPNDSLPYLTAKESALQITFLLYSLIFYSIKKSLRASYAYLGLLVAGCLPFTIKMALSQYADIYIGFYLLAAVVLLSEKSKSSFHFITAGLLLGAASFTKPEGFIASMTVAILALALNFRNIHSLFKEFLPFLISFAVALLPKFYFDAFIASENITFINGLTSTTFPSTIERLNYIITFFFKEIITIKWHTLWITFILGMALTFKKRITKENLLTPAFLLLYLGAVLAYYFVNTEFEIKWWMDVTLNRILFSLLPLLTWWGFVRIFSSENADKSPE